MEIFSAKTERLHALDSLRAIMMMLGIVLHSAVTYSVFPYPGWALKDPNSTHYFFDWLTEFIHSYRMPIFFMVSGFFGALLFYERSALSMLKNRIERILHPFLVFLFLLRPSIIFGTTFSKTAIAGQDHSLMLASRVFFEWNTYFPSRTVHLWFLYYLLMFSLTAWMLGMLFRKFPGFSVMLSQGFDGLIRKPILRIVIFYHVYFPGFVCYKPTIDTHRQGVKARSSNFFILLQLLFVWLVIV